jgi:hypothetical protein
VVAERCTGLQIPYICAVFSSFACSVLQWFAPRLGSN